MTAGHPIAGASSERPMEEKVITTPERPTAGGSAGGDEAPVPGAATPKLWGRFQGWPSQRS